MKKLITSALLFFALTFFGQKGIVFPTIKGVALNDAKITVPASNGKYSVVAIAFHRNAEDDLKKWLNPLFDSFIKVENSESNTGFDMADIYDVNFVFVPMIAGFRRVADDFKKGTDKQ